MTAGREWFKPWRTVTGETLAAPTMTELQVMLEGRVRTGSSSSRFIRDFIVFEDDGSGALGKKMAGYHQFHAVRVAVDETLRAAMLQRAEPGVAEEQGHYEAGRKPGGDPGDRRIGVVWHTQGSGKSLTMAFYSGAVIREPAMENPTVVVLTDRNDSGRPAFWHLLPLPGPAAPAADSGREPRRSALQAFGKRRGCGLHHHPEVLPGGEGATPILPYRTGATSSSSPTRPTVASTTSSTASTGTCGTRCPMPPLSASRGHPSSYRTPTLAPYSATTSASTTSNAPLRTGPRCAIYYESRLAKLALDEGEKPKIDPDFEEATEGEEVERRERLKTKWAQLEAVVGAEKRVRQIAEDIAAHFEQRLEALEGKAMVVCMSRRICIDLYRELTRLRPDWHDDDDGKGAIKVVMTGSASDPVEWQPHIRNKARREELAQRFRDPDAPLKVVLVRDMWLTGFDAPSLHTMYVDKSMRGHWLMQAIAQREPRVQRQARWPRRGLSGASTGPEEGTGDLHRERRQGTNGAGPGRSGGRHAGEA